MRGLLLIFSHAVALVVGVALGIYLLPILTAAPAPDAEALRASTEQATFTGTFRRDLTDSDALHWGEGRLYVGADTIAFQGRLAPGPDYRLYLSPAFVDTEADFASRRAEMVEVGPVRSFGDFMLPVPKSIDPAQFSAAIVWCESFGQFITAAEYQ